MKRIALAFLVIAALLASLAPVAAQDETLLDVLNSRPELSMLAAAVEAAGLSETLADPALAITLFAPVNTAFDFAPAELDALLADPATLQALLFQHAIQGQNMAADLSGAVSSMSTMMEGGALSATTTGVGRVLVGGAFVIEADIIAGNSVIHTIDSVLVPVELRDVIRSPQTTTAQNREIGRMFVQELVGATSEEQRTRVANAIVAEDYIQHNPLVGQGRQGLLDFLPALPVAFSNLNITLEDVMAEEDRIAVRWTIAGTHTGSFLGYEPTGRDFSFGIIDVWVVEDGMVVEHWDEVGWLFWLLQIGVTEFPPPALAQQ